MRVASMTTYEMIKLNLANITEGLYEANKTVATGKRINSLSDDPVGLAQALNIKSSLSNIEQLGRNISMGNSWLTASENALTQVQEQVSTAKALCVQMASATTGADQRNSAAVTVQNMLEEVVSLANTDVNGRYVFAGSKTDAAAFTLGGSSVTYNGDSNAFKVKTGRNATVEVGRDGESVFQASGADIFDILSNLKTALENNNVSGIQSAMSDFDTYFDHITTQISDVGSKMARMEIKENVLQGLDLVNTERLSKIEDADITEAIMELQAQDFAYKAALASASQVLQVSLIDYL
jgi:flagellar hook-associated protein 3 FlgL